MAMMKLQEEILRFSKSFDGEAQLVTIPIGALTGLVVIASTGFLEPLYERMFTQDRRIEELLASNSQLLARARHVEAERDALAEELGQAKPLAEARA
jgi:type II secretory pathway component PulM